MALQRVVGCLALTLLCTAPLGAQQDTCMHRSIPVSVLTLDGKMVTGLDATNFRGSYQHRPARILSTATDIRPGRIVLLLDTSGSMMGRDDRTLALNVAEALLTQMPSQTQIGLAAFALKIDRAVELTTERQRLEGELTALRAGLKALPRGPRKTALWDAIRSGLAMFGTPQPGDVIYVITDGDDNSSETSPSALEQVLLSAGVRLFAFRLYEPRADITLDGTTVQYFADFVTTTGGLALSLPRDQQGWGYALADKSGKPTLFGKNLALQVRLITAFERLEIELPEPVDKPRGWELKVTNLGKLKARNLSVMYPLKLMPCPATAAK